MAESPETIGSRFPARTSPWRDRLYYRRIHPFRLWLAKLIGGETVRHCLRGYELALVMIDDEQAKDDAAVAAEWSE